MWEIRREWKREVQRRCIICVGEVNVIIIYVILPLFFITKYLSVSLSNLWKLSIDNYFASKLKEVIYKKMPWL